MPCIPFSRNSARKFIALVLIGAITVLLAPPTLTVAATKDLAETVQSTASSARPRLGRMAAAFRGTAGQGSGQSRGMPPLPEPSSSSAARAPERGEEREARIFALALNPRSDVTLEVGQTSMFSAVPLDHEGNPIHGLKAEWQSSNPEVIAVNGEGEVLAGSTGNAVITATLASKRETIRVLVIPPARPSGRMSLV